MTTAEKIITSLCLAGVLLFAAHLAAPPLEKFLDEQGWLHASVAGSTVCIVRQTEKDGELPAEIVAAINSQKLADDCAAQQITLFARVDPKLIDKLGGSTPPDLKAAIDRAAKAGLPRVVIKSRSGRLTDRALPATAAELRRAIGL